MVQSVPPSEVSVSEPHDSNLRHFLQRQADVELDEVQTKTINEWINISYEYLRDFDEAVLKHYQETAYIKFLVASRISCILIPAHPKYSDMTTAERMADDLLRKKILDNFDGFMRTTIPAVIARETAMLQAGQHNSRRTDRLTPPASPALSSLAGLENDRRSFLSSDSTTQSHNLANDEGSVYSVSTTGHASNGSFSAYDLPQFVGSQQDVLLMERAIPMVDPLIVDDNQLFAEASALFGTLVPMGQSQGTNLAENTNEPHGSSHRVNHERHQSASAAMAEIFEQIDEQIGQQNLRKYTSDSDISSDDEVYQESSNNAKASTLRPSINARNLPFPTVGFHNGRGGDDDTFTVNAHYAGSPAETAVDDPLLSPTSEIFSLELTSRANSMSRANTIVERRSDISDLSHGLEQHSTAQDNHDYGLEADFNNLDIRRTSSITTHVLSPMDSITLSLQDSNDVVYKPDENDGTEDPLEGTSGMHKPDAVISSALSIASSTSSKAMSDSSASPSTSRGKFSFGFGKVKKTIKVDALPTPTKSSATPPGTSARRKESKTLHTYSPYASHYKPFGSIIAPGSKKPELPKSSANTSQQHLPTHHAPAPRVTMPKTRNSISDDGKLVSDDEELPSQPFGASIPDGRDPLADHRGSIASKPLPIPKVDEEPSSPLPTNTVSYRSLSSQGVGEFSTSPASISGTSKPNVSPNSTSESYEPDRSIPIHRVGARVEKLRRHAQTNLDCIKYMSFVDLVSFATDLFANMRKLEMEEDYENAYIHGMQGMIISTYVLRRHPDCRAESGIAFYRYIELVEIINFRYKTLLTNIQTILENDDQVR